MYPSRRQRFRQDDVRVFELDHDIPICESISPVSSYRWHAMDEAEVAAYRRRLTDEVVTWMDEIESATGDRFDLAIAHHAFMNAVVLRDVNRRRVAAGRGRMTLLCFAHGTELKMFAHERSGDDPAEFPPRFLPFMATERIFEGTEAIDAVAAISTEQVEAFLGVFPTFPRERVLMSHNGYNQAVFRPLTEPVDVHADREQVLAGFTTQPPEGTGRTPGPVVAPDGFDAVVAFCGKFAAWKRLDALLRAAAIYERAERRILTLVIGSGPHEAQVEMHDLADELGLRRTFFVGPRQQDELAVLFNTADVGCFPSHREPFGLVFIECLACGTPVIGADSGGPRDFVGPEVGHLVPETDDPEALARSLADAVERAVAEDWKQVKGPTCASFVAANFSVVRQVEDLLASVEALRAG